MQLFALDPQKKVTFIHEAERQQDYHCLECGCPVRKRGGSVRQEHFYHCLPNPHCRQNGKSLSHLQLQLFLYHLIGQEQVVLEKRFDTVSRIADVCWEKEKLIFEIQCSPISAREIHERNSDYLKLGYQVIWILHDKRYNQQRLTPAELYLQKYPHYYTNIDEEGQGIVYDQAGQLNGNYFKNRHGPFPIQPNRPYRSLKMPLIDPLLLRYQKIGFQGDYAFEHLFQKGKPASSFWLWKDCSFFLKRMKKIYEAFFKMLLEKMCWKG